MPQVLKNVYKYLSNNNTSKDKNKAAAAKAKRKKKKGKTKPTGTKSSSSSSSTSSTPTTSPGITVNTSAASRKPSARTVARTPHATTRAGTALRSAAQTKTSQDSPINQRRRVKNAPTGAAEIVGIPQVGGTEPPLLPPQSAKHLGRLTVVLDMDETLLHSEFLNIDDDPYRQEEERLTDRTVEPDHIVSLVCEEIEGEVAIRKRPYLDSFIEQACQEYELVLFTAGHEEYASRVLDVVDKDHKITYRLFRQSTVTYRGQGFVKDLSRLGRDMRRIVLLDNNFLAMLASPDNSIPIFDFYGDPKDEELKSTLILLRYLAKMDDVRPFLRKTFQVRKKFDELGSLLDADEGEYEEEEKE